jgi:hypothetical protein
VGVWAYVAQALDDGERPGTTKDGRVRGGGR